MSAQLSFPGAEMITATAAKVARPIERLGFCDECSVAADHLAGAPDEFGRGWRAYCFRCAEEKGVPWGAIGCCVCKRKTKALVGLIVDGKCSPVCRACKEAGGR